MRFLSKKQDPWAHQALSLATQKATLRELVLVCRIIVCEILQLQRADKRLKERMDKQIKKVAKDIKKDQKKKAMKDVSHLLKMDKKFDAKLEKCDKKMGKK